MNYCLLVWFEFYVPVKSYGHVEMVSSPNLTWPVHCAHTFAWNLTSGRGENDLWNYFMINLQEIWDWAGINLATALPIVGLVTDCALGSSQMHVRLAPLLILQCGCARALIFFHAPLIQCSHLSKTVWRIYDSFHLQANIRIICIFLQDSAVKN